METQIYHSHPIFEFYLTAYFAIIIAPKFLSEYFNISASQRFHKNDKIRLGKKLDKLDKKSENNLLKFENQLPSLDISDSSKAGLAEYIEDCRVTLENNSKELFEAITKKKTSIIKREIVPYLRNRHENILILMSFYNFLILVSYGCEYSFIYPFPFMVKLLNFNFLFMAFLAILILRQILYDELYMEPNIKVKGNRFKTFLSNRIIILFEKLRYNYMYSLIILFLIILLTYKWRGLFEVCTTEGNFMNLSLLMTIFIGGGPLVSFSLSLRKNSRKLFSFEYKRKKRTHNEKIALVFEGLRNTFRAAK